MTDTNGNGGGVWRWVAGGILAALLLVGGAEIRSLAMRMNTFEQRQFEGQNRISTLEAIVGKGH